MEWFAGLYSRIGAAGVVLVLLGIFVIYFAVKTAVILLLTSRSFNKAAQLINSNAAEQDSVIALNLDNPIVAIINEVVKTHGSHSDDIKAEVAYLFNLHFSKVMRDLTLIRVIAAISPMLGLLGTLLGLMGVFGSLASTTSLSTSTILAAGIWEAIITTIMGITLAIPALIVYHLLRLKLKTFHLATVEYSYRFLDGKKHPSQQFQGNIVEPMRRKEAAV